MIRKLLGLLRGQYKITIVPVVKTTTAQVKKERKAKGEQLFSSPHYLRYQQMSNQELAFEWMRLFEQNDQRTTWRATKELQKVIKERGFIDRIDENGLHIGSSPEWEILMKKAGFKY
jgi:hypothetical protein